ncbi:hypothetical protein BDV10DRAFT_190233 [Aspergillus recurvatus]
MASTVKRTEECLEELEARFKATKTPSDVLLILGRTDSGKSSLLEDLSGLGGYSQQDSDSATRTMELGKAIIKGKPYFIMDTPGFDPAAEEKTFSEIVRGVESIRPFARITGFLYLTCISQRSDDFDRKLIQLIRALGGTEYIPRVTFITTFWTATPGQAASYSQRLMSLQRIWKDGVGVQDLKTYQHGREYNAAGEDTGSIIDWYIDRAQIARHAKEMVARNYGNPSIVASKIERELHANVPIHETDAGKLLGLRAPYKPTTTAQGAAGSDEGGSPTGASSRAHERAEPSQATPASRNTNQEQTATQTEWGPLIVDGLSWLFRNVNISSVAGGRGGVTGPNLVRGDPYRGGGDPLSHVDFMKSLGLDSSRQARLDYARNHGIGGVPFSAEWGDAMLRHLRKHG